MRVTRTHCDPARRALSRALDFGHPRGPVSRTVVGYASILLAACFWGGSASLGKRLLEAGVPTMMLMEVRTLVSGGVLVGALAARSPARLRVPARDLPLLAVYGVSLAGVNVSYYEAIRWLPVATAVFIQFTAPALVFAYGVATGRERPRLATTAALVLSMAGTNLMVGGSPAALGSLPLVGLACAIASTVLYAFGVVVSHRLARRLPVTTVVAYGWIVGGLFWAIVQSVPATVQQLALRGLLGSAVLFACLSMLVPMPLFTAGVARVSATGAAIAASSETVAASAIAFLVLGEALTPAQMAGGVLILGSVLLLATRRDASTSA